MTIGVFVLIGLAGGVGAASRFVVDGLTRARVALQFPLGTVLINITGSLLLGILTGLLVDDDSLRLILGTGFCGGYTTFSTSSYETVDLLRSGRYVAATLNSVGLLLVAVPVAWIGIRLGALL